MNMLCTSDKITTGDVLFIEAVTINEMKAFIGIILNMGIIQLQRIRDYWSTFLSFVMSQDRFLQILGMLHVGEIDAQDLDKAIYSHSSICYYRM